MEDRVISSRSDVARLLLNWIRPLKTLYSSGCAQVKIGCNLASYGDRDGKLEGFARILWGIGPLLSQDNTMLPTEAQVEIESWKNITRTGLINGTDPFHAEYWGVASDYDHKFVEMAAIANAIILAPQVYWDPLSNSQRDNLVHWFWQINERQIYGNNWISFRILVNIMLCKLGVAQWSEQMEWDIGVFEKNYEGSGWYHDGHPGQKDYYISFAMHFYGLLISHYLKQTHPEYCQKLSTRAQMFYNDFVYWFDDQGRSVPFGRSLTYRFAHTAAFSAMAFTDVCVPVPQIRHLVLENLRYWSCQPIFDNSGILSIGYGYPNLFMSEMYNSGGSPYWAFKTFLILALPKEHPFWNCKDEMPLRQNQKLIRAANMLAVQGEPNHAMLYPAGHFAANAGNIEAKYQKFVYSSEFGFSVSRGYSLLDGAFDNTLAANLLGDVYWRVRRRCQQFELTPTYTRSLYELLPGVQVETVVIPRGNGHVRVHYVKTKHPIELADGGFSIAREKNGCSACKGMIRRDNDLISCEFPWGISLAASLDHAGKPEAINTFPNTNLMSCLAMIPTIQYTVHPGHAVLITYFYGRGNSQSDMDIPRAQIVNEKIVITYAKKDSIKIEGKKWL